MTRLLCNIRHHGDLVPPRNHRRRLRPPLCHLHDPPKHLVLAHRPGQRHPLRPHLQRGSPLLRRRSTSHLRPPATLRLVPLAPPQPQRPHPPDHATLAPRNRHLDRDRRQSHRHRRLHHAPLFQRRPPLVGCR